MTEQSGPVSVDDVIVPPEPWRDEAKTSRATDALLQLSQTLAESPGLAAQRLAEAAMRLTKAGSAGVSVEDTREGEPVFRWIATTGDFARYQGDTMPRHFSPCAETLARGRALVMRDPGRYWGYIARAHLPVRSLMLVPFGRGGQLIGTLWVVLHRGGKTFSERDLRSVQDLTTFATAILDARGRTTAA